MKSVLGALGESGTAGAMRWAQRSRGQVQVGCPLQDKGPSSSFCTVKSHPPLTAQGCVQPHKGLQSHPTAFCCPTAPGGQSQESWGADGNQVLASPWAGRKR